MRKHVGRGVEDDLRIRDIEEVVLNGRIVRSDRREPLGPKYANEGLALDGEKLVGTATT